MIDKVPGSTNPFMRCGAAIPDRALPQVKRETIADFTEKLKAFFCERPTVVTKRIDDVAVRFEVDVKVYGGAFIGSLLFAAVSAGILDASQYEAWGISWFPTYGDLLELCHQFLASEATETAQAA